MKLIFATHNENKVKEINALTPSSIQVVSLTEMGYHDEIEETENTLNGNSALKAESIYRHFGENCFAEDSGLLINALAGKPGVYSARFAGEHKSDQDNIDKVLQLMKSHDNREAKFQSVITLITNDEKMQFVGEVEGYIVRKAIYGRHGFGYDPIFQPKGYNKVFAEMELTKKLTIDHRAIAFRKMLSYLDSNISNI